MKRLLTLIFFMYAIVFTFQSCCVCKVKFFAGLNLENADRCFRSKGKECYEDVYVCKGDKVYLCWAGADYVQQVKISGIGDVAKEGCMTITATTDIEYVLTVTHNHDCENCPKPFEKKLRINVIEEGEQVNIVAANPDNKSLLWEIKYPKGQVSPNIVITSIKPICGASCYPVGTQTTMPLTVSDKITINNCGALDYCNGSWSCLKINIDGSGIPNAVAIVPNQLTQFPSPFPPLIGTWQFTPSGSQYPSTNSLAFFTLTAKCVGNN
jgi:hypothetical protein